MQKLWIKNVGQMMGNVDTNGSMEGDRVGL